MTKNELILELAGVIFDVLDFNDIQNLVEYNRIII